jgi:hypothetical protein
VRWSASSGRLPASLGRRCRAKQTRRQQRKEVDNRRSAGAHCRQTGPRWGTLLPCYEPVPRTDARP